MIFFEPHDEMKKCIITIHNDVAIYDYDKLIEYFMRDFLESASSLEEAYTNAEEWVDYNLIRSIPYLGKEAPKVVSLVDEEDLVEGDVYLEFNDAKYILIE
jgi:hypothetical protein